MAIEIERKFLVKDPNVIFKSDYSYIISQIYFNDVTRIRFEQYSDEFEKAYITIKTPIDEKDMLSRKEGHFEIPYEDALEFVNSYEKNDIVIKKRCIVYHGVNNLKWEVDYFLGSNEGLIIAEIELHSEDQKIEMPEWIGEEVTNVDKYYNSSLAKKPYKDWKNE
jgi:adenylate cyclase